MTINLNKLKDDELTSLISDAQSILGSRQEERRQVAIDKIRQIAAEGGVDLAELVSKLQGKRTKDDRPPVAPKYRNPGDASQTWSGRGKRPAWVVAHVDGGGTMESIAI